MKYFQSVDILSPQVYLLFDGNNQLKTRLGGLISCITFLLLILLIIAFGNDFFKRINPIFIPIIFANEEYQNFFVNNKNFTIAFKLQDYDTFPINDSRAFYIQFIHWEYQKNS